MSNQRHPTKVGGLTHHEMFKCQFKMWLWLRGLPVWYGRPGNQDARKPIRVTKIKMKDCEQWASRLYPWSSTTEFNICKQANRAHIFANSHDMLLLKFDLLNSLTGTLWAWHGTQCCRMPCTCTLYLQVYCCAVCICYGINSRANQRHAIATVRCIWALGETINKNNVPQMHWHCDFVPKQQVGIHTGSHHFMKFSQIFNK